MFKNHIVETVSKSGITLIDNKHILQWVIKLIKKHKRIHDTVFTQRITYLIKCLLIVKAYELLFVRK